MTVALIDGDVICYRACENRWKRKLTNTDDLIMHGVVPEDTSDVYIITGEDDFSDEENAKYLYEAFEVYKQIVAELLDTTFAESHKTAVAGVGNYRKDIFPEYKMNRHNADAAAKRNPFVPLLRTMAAEAGIAVRAHGMEADDLLRIWAEELRAAGEQYVVCSIDKDLKMIPGMHYLIHKREFFESTEAFALAFYYQQLLMGDQTDNIQGAPGIGPIKAAALLEGCATEAEYQEVVQQVFFSTTHQWRYALQLTGQLIYLKKHKDDWFDSSTWQTVTLEDVTNAPKKSKKKMEEWTLESAIAAVNPRSITGRERWASAVMFLVEQEGLPAEIHDIIEVLSNRDQVPQVEIDAYERLKKMQVSHPAPFTISAKLAEVTGVPALPFPGNLPITAIADTSYVPILPPVPDKIVAQKVIMQPLGILDDKPSGMHPPSFKLPEIKPIGELPAFSSSWGKKK